MPSPFDPTPTQDTPQATMPQAPQGAPGTTDLASGWQNWIAKPDNRAALMQFGVAMLQPVGVGETPLSHAASAVGHGGEAAARVQGQELKEREVSSKEDLRASQANLAESRATTAGARSDTAAARLGIAQQSLDLKQQQFNTNIRIAAELAYQRYLKQHADASQKYALLGPASGLAPPDPPESREQFMARIPGIGGGGVPQTPGLMPSPQEVEQARTFIQANPNDPRALALKLDFAARGVQF